MSAGQDRIECRFRWTLDEFITAHREHRRTSRKLRRLLQILWGIALVSVAVGIVRLINLGYNRTSVVLLIVGISIAYSRTLTRPMLTRMFRRLPEQDAEVHCRIDGDRLVIETPFSRTETAWTAITGAMHTGRGFLIYPQPGLFYWLPDHGFASAADVERCRRLVTERKSSQLAG